MRKVREGLFLFISLFIVGGLFFKGVPSVLAAQPGINIGSHHSEFDQAANLVGPGGWVVVMATPGDCPWLSQMIRSHNVNVIIRGHYPDQNFAGQSGTNWAISWAYTLASMDTGGKKVFFMPLNEPNQTGSGDYQPPAVVINYTNKLINQFNKLGIRGSKVELLSPMFNSNRPDVAGYINALLSQEPNFFQKFDSISMNLYDVENYPGDVFHKQDQVPVTDASKFRSLLRLYRAENKPVYGVEAGVVHPNEGVVYRDEYLKPFVEKAERSLGSVMFAVFSYDPEHQEPWNIFNSQTAEAYRNFPHNGQVAFGAPSPKSALALLNQAKAEGLNLTRCHPDGCGLATSADFCSVYGGGINQAAGDFYQPRVEPVEGDVASAISDPVRLIQKEEIKYPDSGPRNVARGLFLEEFGGITIPYARSIAQYLAGDLIYNGRQTNPSVLTRLLTINEKDAYRKKYWTNCKNGVYCNGYNSDLKRCPNQANECALLTTEGRIEISAIPPKPLAKDFSSYAVYLQALNKWKTNPLSKYWKDIPLFANPITFVGGALSVDACPPFSDQGSTVHTKFPWLKALRDVSQTLNNLLVSKSNDSQVSMSRPSTKTASSLLLPPKTDNSHKFLAEADCSQMKNIFQASIRPYEVKRVGGGLSVCWEFTARSNDSNYSVGDWGLMVIAQAAGQTKTRYAPMLGGASNVIGTNGVRLDCHMGTFGGPFFFPGISDPQKVSLSFQITGGRCKGALCGVCDYRNFIQSSGQPFKLVCRPPAPPEARQLADPQPVPVEISGHQRLRGPVRKLYCNKWVPTGKSYVDGNGNRVPAMECKEGRTSYNVSDPLWVYVYYPYLNTIAANLVYKERGAFRIFVSDRAQTKDWFQAGTSNISFCASVYDDVLRGHFLAEGMSPDVVNSFKSDVMHNVALSPWTSRDYFSNNNDHFNRGQCALGDHVEDVKLYPPYLGGIMNAVDMVSQCLNTDNNEPFCRR